MQSESAYACPRDTHPIPRPSVYPSDHPRFGSIEWQTGMQKYKNSRNKNG